jgi:hypothetical protein
MDRFNTPASLTESHEEFSDKMRLLMEIRRVQLAHYLELERRQQPPAPTPCPLSATAMTAVAPLSLHDHALPPPFLPTLRDHAPPQ